MIVPLRNSSWAALIAAGLLLAGCDNDPMARAPIEGRITVGGQALASGRILFVPVAPNSGPATSARIVDGVYRLPRREGPVVGQNRVEVQADVGVDFPLDDEAAFAERRGRRLPPDPIPPEFNRRSTLVAEVKEGETNTFDVTIPQARHVTARVVFPQ